MTDQNRFSSDGWTAEERRLAEALAAEAEPARPSPAPGLGTIRQRISELPTRSSRPGPAGTGVRGWSPGCVALGLAAAATMFAVNGGLQQQTVPDPAQTPTSSPDDTGTRFDPSSPAHLVDGSTATPASTADPR